MSNVKQELETKIIKKAWEDAEFKKELLSDPRSTIQKALEIALPDNVEIKIVEEGAKTAYLVLPANPIDIQQTVSTSDTGDLQVQSATY